MSNRFSDAGRTAIIEEKVSASNRTAPLVAWPRANKDLPLIELEVDWVRFSTLNHRTRAQQYRAIKEAEKEDLFSEDPLGELAQAAQVAILRATREYENLMEDLEERGQQEPAVVTAEGVLINGNRRSAGLRALWERKKDPKWKYVDCLVLPSDATPEEIRDLETELQVAKDFKESYSWINRGLLIEELYEAYDRKADVVAKRMHIRTQDVTEEIEKIQLVHELVELSKGERFHIDFDGSETAFRELALHLHDRAEDEEVRMTYFLGILAGVQYRDLRHLRREDAGEFVVRELREESRLSGVVQHVEGELGSLGAGGSSEEDEVLEGVLGAPQQPSLLQGVLNFLADKEPGDYVDLPSEGGEADDEALTEDILSDVREVITRASREAEEERQDLKVKTAPIDRLVRAIDQLERSRDSLAKARATPGWDENAFMEKLEAAGAVLEQLKAAGD